jgi:anaerobic selenocysteine-containing dehydrogenase
MFLTETAQSADVFLPLAAYLECEGHLTSWEGVRQPSTPIGAPVTGMSNIDILGRLLQIEQPDRPIPTHADVAAELQVFHDKAGIHGRIDGTFTTADGRAHFPHLGDLVLTVSAKIPTVLEIDARMEERMSLIKA